MKKLATISLFLRLQRWLCFGRLKQDLTGLSLAWKLMSVITLLICLSRVCSADKFDFTPMAAQKVAAKVMPIKSAVKSFQLRKTCLIGYISGIGYQSLVCSDLLLSLLIRTPESITFNRACNRLTGLERIKSQVRFLLLAHEKFSGYLKAENMSLFTDYYELTMCASYFDNKNFEPATFDLFIRRLPENRSYFLFAGLEEALQYLQNIKFTDEHLST